MEMWILVGTFIICLLTGVNADESRTALIASGCVAGGLLVVGLGVIAIFVILRHKRRKEKKNLTRHKEHVGNGYYRPTRDASQPSTIRAPDSRREEPRGLGAKAFTQHPVLPRQRPPVAFYTMRTDPREIPGVMGSPGYGRPPPVGQPVIFLDWRGAPIHSTDSESLIQDTTRQSDRPRRQTSKDTSRDGREQPRSKSRSRSRDPKVSSTRRHSDTNLPSLLAAPGDVIMQTRNGGPGIHIDRPKEVPDTNNNRYQVPDVKIENDIQTRNYLHHVTVDQPIRDIRDEPEIPTRNSVHHVLVDQPIRDSVHHVIVDQPIRDSVHHVMVDQPIRDVQGTNTYASDWEPYSVTQLQTSPTVYPSAINANPYLYNLRQEDVATDTARSSDNEPLPTPAKDYPIDSPRTSVIDGTPHVVAADNRTSSASHDNEPEATKTAWVNFPTVKPVDNIYEDTEEMNTIATPTVHLRGRSGRRPHEVKDETTRLSHRQDPSLIRPPSPPRVDRPPTPPSPPRYERPPTPPSPPRSERPPTPPFDAMSIIYPNTLSLAKSSNSVTNNIHRSLTPPPDMSPGSDIFNAHTNPRPPSPPTFSPGNLRPRPQTPPAGLTKPDLDFDLDDIIKMGNEPSPISNPVTSRPSTESPHNVPPFLEELTKRQRSMEDSTSYSPPPSTKSASFPPANAHFQGRADSSSDEEDYPPTPKHTHASLHQKSSVVQFSDHPPEVFHRAGSHDSGGQVDNELSNDLWTGAGPTSPPAPPPPPPPPPPLPPLR